jgi:hypothetical protein
LNTSFSSLQNVTADAQLGGLSQAQQIANFTGSGTCTPVTNSSSLCSPANLANAGFPNNTNVTQASSICNGESGGTANQESTTDTTDDGQAFSFGLFQINAAAHANDIQAPDGSYPCKGAFGTPVIIPNNPNGTRTTDSTLGSCMKVTNGVCTQFDLPIGSQQQYNTCEAYLLSPANNIAIAVKMENANGWGAWGADKSCPF